MEMLSHELTKCVKAPPVVRTPLSDRRFVIIELNPTRLD